jgi:hypothetical protein
VIRRRREMRRDLVRRGARPAPKPRPTLLRPSKRNLEKNVAVLKRCGGGGGGGGGF